MKTGVLLIVAVIVVALVLIVGAFALRQSRQSGDPAQFAQFVSTLCVQSQTGTSECGTLAAVLRQTPAAATGLPACAAEYPSPLATKFAQCVEATLGIPATMTAALQQVIAPTQTLAALLERYGGPLAHLCAGAGTPQQLIACSDVLRPLVIPANERVLQACEAIIPPLTRNTSEDDVSKYIKCLNDNGIAVQLPK